MSGWLDKHPGSLFGTTTLLGHPVRGVVALALLAAAITGQQEHPVLSMGAGLMALVAMRGCPACWTMGLVETLRQRLRR